MNSMKIAALLVASVLLTWAVAVSENQAYACSGLSGICPEGESIWYLHNPFSWINLFGIIFP